jgi:hypothetical protein
MMETSLNYTVAVTGLDQVKAQADSAAKSADLASNSVKGLQSQGVRTMPLVMNALQTVNSLRSSVDNVTKAMETMNPEAMIYALLSMISVATNLMQVMRLLRESTATAAAAQAVLNTLAGAWWLIPLAITAGILVAQSIRSMQTGGPVAETGVYLLHRGEYVVPANQVTSYGPIYVSLPAQPGGLDVDDLLRALGPRLAGQIRRATG